jgi:hypothetical protein
MQLTPKMSANLWRSTYEDANLQTCRPADWPTTHSIIISNILYNLGKQVCVSEQGIKEGSSNYVTYVTANWVIVGHKKMSYDLFQVLWEDNI